MRYIIFFLIIIYSTSSNSQCTNCGTNIGGWVNDYIEDIDSASDGIVLTTLQRNFYSGIIYKFDNNCNLIWTFNKLEFAAIHKTTLDNNDNIYSLVSSDSESTVDGVIIYQGMNLVKISSDGNLLWSKKIGGQVFGARIHYSNNHLILHGRFAAKIDINNEITLTTNTGEENHYLAKFSTTGDLINAISYGEANLEEIPLGSDIDENGNLYITGRYENSAYLIKFNFDFDLVWNKEISNRDNNGLFYPSNLFFNKLNNKIYVWGNYTGSANILGNNFTTDPECIYGKNSAIGEFENINGDLINAISFNNCSTQELPSFGGNWRDDNVSNGYMASKGNELYVLSSFRRDKLEFKNGTVTSTFTGSYYNEDLVLFKLDLDDFSKEYVLQTEGENTFSNPDITYRDGPGPILIKNESIYLTAFFESLPLYIDNNTINNNSGNLNTDILYYKYSLDPSVTFADINYENTCLGDTTNFQVTGTFDSVLWNFDDPSSGANNTSTSNTPIHTFSQEGAFNVSVEITCGSQTETIRTEVFVSTAPIINTASNIFACEDTFNSGFSSSFVTSNIENQIIGNQTNIIIEYYDQEGMQLSSPLPNPMSNSVLGQETIIARVAYNNNLTCFTEISFDLIVNPLPEINEINNIYACDDDNDGITEFDISYIETNISDNQSGMIVEFFRENGQQLPNPLPNTVQNIVINKETITARITNPNSNCYNESFFDLIVYPLPEANQLQIIYGCDDNNDGISEYLDTSNIESQVLNGQTGMTVSYFDQIGNTLPNPLPNPYTNTNAFNELITVRVTDNNSTCYAETTLQLQTVTQPNLNHPNNLYSCDQGNGYAKFDTSIKEQELIGNQTGLTIQYFDSNYNPLPSPLPVLFQNTEPFIQTISIRVEDSSNPTCYSETSFDLIINKLPEINLENEYYICNLEPSISLSINSGFNTYDWFYQDGSLISNKNSAVIADEGNYTLTVTEIKNGVTCENSFEFTLIRSVLPEIQQVNFGELGNNYIEIIASGDGDFEYSIDGINYQDSNYFSSIQGGMYTVFVRDKDGCGQDSEEVTLVDYPKFFTPNNDGYNDFWQIKGIANFPNSETLIFDRYGKLLARILSNDLGWNGLYNGNQMMSNDYWFRTDLGNGRTFSGHFSLKM